MVSCHSWYPESHKVIQPFNSWVEPVELGRIACGPLAVFEECIVSLVSNTPKLSPCATRACDGSSRKHRTLRPHTCSPSPVRLWVFLCQAHTAHLRDPCRTPSESRVAPVNFGEVDHTDRELRQKIGPRTGRPRALVTQTDLLSGEAGWWLATRQKSAAWSPTAGEEKSSSPATARQGRGLLSRGLWKTKHRFVGMCVMDIHFTAVSFLVKNQHYYCVSRKPKSSSVL
jgi:hypothetical protein